jgi:hypothetical protein
LRLHRATTGSSSNAGSDNDTNDAGSDNNDPGFRLGMYINQPRESLVAAAMPSCVR